MIAIDNKLSTGSPNPYVAYAYVIFYTDCHDHKKYYDSLRVINFFSAAATRKIIRFKRTRQGFRSVLTCFRPSHFRILHLSYCENLNVQVLLCSNLPRTRKLLSENEIFNKNINCNRRRSFKMREIFFKLYITEDRPVIMLRITLKKNSSTGFFPSAGVMKNYNFLRYSPFPPSNLSSTSHPLVFLL